MTETGYPVEKLFLYSMDDNKKYKIPLPAEDKNMFDKFEKLIDEMKHFQIEDFVQNNPKKCRQCIYEPACAGSSAEEEE